MRYDIAVIGAGPGGYVAAISAAQNGLKTLLIERDSIGGTCLNRGCIPTKALLFCTEQYTAAKKSADFGVELSCSGFDYSKAFAHKSSVVKKLVSGVSSLVKYNGVTFMSGEAKITSPHTLEVNGEEIEFTNLIIATGSKPAPAPFKISEGANVIDSDGFLALDTLPDEFVIAGGGVIGIEFASILSNIGKKVTIIEAADSILPLLDGELSDFVRAKSEKSGVTFKTATFVDNVRGESGKTVCTLKDKATGVLSEISCDVVLCAIGRRAEYSGLCPENAGVKTDKKGILTDEYCRTNVPHIYAIGDVNSKCMLAHAASYQAKQVVKTILTMKNHSCDDKVIPSCVYCDPEIASVGLTEKQALAKGIDVKCGYFNASGNGKLLSNAKNEGFIKIVTDKLTGEILGAQLCCDRATDMISEIALAIDCELTAEEIASCVHPHPTVSEAVMEAAEDAVFKSVHKIYK